MDQDEEEEDDSDIKLFKVSDHDGTLDMDLVKEYKVEVADLDPNVRNTIRLL